MEKYYCNQCTINLGLINLRNGLNFTGTTDQFTKFIKHTVYNPLGPGIISVFNSPSYSDYYSYIYDTLRGGSTEFDYNNKKNILLPKSTGIGITFMNGVSSNTLASFVKVVLPDNDKKIHAFPIIDNNLSMKPCYECGGFAF